MKYLKDIHKGEKCYIIGKGPSLQFLCDEDISDGIVITINDSYRKVEALWLPNQMYAIMKDGGVKKVKSADNLTPTCNSRGECGDQCGNMLRPKNAETLIVHDLESKFCFENYPYRHVVNLKDLGLEKNYCSMVFAIKLAHYMGIVPKDIFFVAFDMHTHGDSRTYTQDGQVVTMYDYSHQVTEVKPFLEGSEKWITPQNPKNFIGFGVLCNDIGRMQNVFLKSCIDKKVFVDVVYNPDYSCAQINRLLDVIEKQGKEIAIISHQDMYFKGLFLPELMRKIKKLPDSWGVIGIVGKDLHGKLCGNMWDTRFPHAIKTYHPFPVQASCLDECVLIFNLKNRLRLDEKFTWFHLYGTLAVHQAREARLTAWIIDDYAEHFCTRSLRWSPIEDRTFQEAYKYLLEKFPEATLDSTVFAQVENRKKQQVGKI